MALTYNLGNWAARNGFPVLKVRCLETNIVETYIGLF